MPNRDNGKWGYLEMELLTLKETQDYLKTSKSALYRLFDKGVLKPIKITGKPLIIKEQIDTLIRRQLKNA